VASPLPIFCRATPTSSAGLRIMIGAESVDMKAIPEIVFSA
jgi:hypothetical protein